ncbi:cyclin-dependent kinase 20-like [Neocloeon triangulifer]|uniref:cyclin-dependent kinase 20-like n=1 Tax=Neocloeon triangulifer TaxID=2078957 RepID=UPI00286EF736|nr:cyclin-dependent kinase 20-like [Neocloeon triangulifer]
MDQYKALGHIGEGAHGVVTRAVHKATGKDVAMKKLYLRRPDEEVPIQILREIKLLQKVQCKYVIKLLEVLPQGICFVLVFEYMPTGLAEMIKDPQSPLTEAQIKRYLEMLLQGVEYLHSQYIMHRDLKPANLLISYKGVLKIADLGQARLFDLKANEKRPYSHQVASRWYRAPELLYGAKIYTEAVDIWAVGCIFGEMLNRAPLFRGASDIEQLCVVQRMMGTPSTRDWPELETLPDYNKITFTPMKALPFEKIIPNCSSSTLDLTKKFIVYNPSLRISAKKALEHKYFFSMPLPCPMPDMPKPFDGHREKFNQDSPDVGGPSGIFNNFDKMQII